MAGVPQRNENNAQWVKSRNEFDVILLCESVKFIGFICSENTML